MDGPEAGAFQLDTRGPPAFPILDIFSRQNTMSGTSSSNSSTLGFAESVLSCRQTSGAEISMNEYKQYIYDQISKLLPKTRH